MLTSPCSTTDTKEKPYVCDRCPEAFSRRDLLKRHEVKAHDYTKGLRQRRQSRVPSDSSSKSRKKAAEESAAAGTDVSVRQKTHITGDMAP